MASIEIPDIVIGRLPVYLRALSVMAAAGQEITSSHELGEKLGISSAQIRKDLSHFGEFGKQGKGYAIPFLVDQLQLLNAADGHILEVVVSRMRYIASAVKRAIRIVALAASIRSLGCIRNSNLVESQLNNQIHKLCT